MTEFKDSDGLPKSVTSDGAFVYVVMAAKGVVTFFDTEKDLGRAPVACEWAVAFHCCTVPLDCLLTLST